MCTRATTVRYKRFRLTKTSCTKFSTTCTSTRTRFGPVTTSTTTSTGNCYYIFYRNFFFEDCTHSTTCTTTNCSSITTSTSRPTWTISRYAVCFICSANRRLPHTDKNFFTRNHIKNSFCKSTRTT